MLNTCTLPRQTLPDLTTQFSLDSFTLLETELFLFEVGKMRGKERGGAAIAAGGTSLAEVYRKTAKPSEKTPATGFGNFEKESSPD